jgi:hypothetical protein
LLPLPQAAFGSCNFILLATTLLLLGYAGVGFAGAIVFLAAFPRFLSFTVPFVGCVVGSTGLLAFTRRGGDSGVAF